MNLGHDKRAKSGDFFLLDQEVCKTWRRDNHHYRMRMDKRGFPTIARSFNILKIPDVENGSAIIREVKADYINGRGLGS